MSGSRDLDRINNDTSVATEVEFLEENMIPLTKLPKIEGL